jgi:hypothetical protein
MALVCHASWLDALRFERSFHFQAIFLFLTTQILVRQLAGKALAASSYSNSARLSRKQARRQTRTAFSTFSLLPSPSFKRLVSPAANTVVWPAFFFCILHRASGVEEIARRVVNKASKEVHFRSSSWKGRNYLRD